ncbi:MAG TPA: methyltransferase domain-containing protein, partial [Streptosporangiaceae bacterium]|nr:methyltransferase domain-containing protein [Streptosporangiaceae bacterium]
AESRARAALDHDPRDVWSVHARAHVFEMEGHQRDGVEFLTKSAGDWSSSFFAIHNWWHRTLYHLELGETGEALALYDSPIRAGRSTEWLDVVDAAALLWRLSLFGVDVTERAAQLAADIDDLVGDPVYIFNDWHAVMAFALAGDRARVERVILANRHLTAPTNRMAAERAGLDLLEAFGAFAAGRPDRTIDLLIDIRPRANAVGGSHAQRDVIDLTLIAAAARADDDSLARALVTERVARKPSAEASARQLVAENGGSLDALGWLPCCMGESSASDADRVWLSATWPFVRGQLPPPPARVIELGCGPAGGHVRALIKAGYDATGVDPEAPEGPEYVRTPFETYRPDGPADAVVASVSLHHVEDPGQALDHVVEVLRPDGALVIAEWISEDLDEATARWCFRHQLRDQAESGAWLAGMYAGWAASGLGWEAFFRAWLDERGLHPAAAIRRELEARFAVAHLSTAPYYFPDLADADADAEQAAIDTRQIKAGCLRYAGRVRPAPDRVAPRYEASAIGRVESPLTDRAQ